MNPHLIPFPCGSSIAAGASSCCYLELFCRKGYGASHVNTGLFGYIFNVIANIIHFAYVCTCQLNSCSLHFNRSLLHDKLKFTMIWETQNKKELIFSLSQCTCLL